MTMDQALVFAVFATQKRLVTDRQVRRLFALVNLEKNQEIAAAKAGMDRKTARKYLRARRLPSELPQAPRQRTQADAFAEVWGELQELLQINPGLEAKTLFEYVQRQYPGRFQDGQLRTLQRRSKCVGDGRASQGGVFRATAPSWAVECLRFRPYDGPGGYHPEPELPALAVSLRADLFQLGDGDGLFLGEFRKPV
jgi:hypothetical protein